MRANTPGHSSADGREGAVPGWPEVAMQKIERALLLRATEEPKGVAAVTRRAPA